jgi:hypothetical protein
MMSLALLSTMSCCEGCPLNPIVCAGIIRVQIWIGPGVSCYQGIVGMQVMRDVRNRHILIIISLQCLGEHTRLLAVLHVYHPPFTYCLAVSTAARQFNPSAPKPTPVASASRTAPNMFRQCICGRVLNIIIKTLHVRNLRTWFGTVG